MMPLSNITGVAIGRSDHIRAQRELHLVLSREAEGHGINVQPS